MGQCLVKLPHSCGTRKGLQVFGNEDGSVSGYCFNCRTPVKDPLGEGVTADQIPVAKRIKKTPEEIQEEIEEISQYHSIDLPERRLRGATMALFGVKVGVSQQDGETPEFQYFPYYRGDELVDYKVKYMPEKRFWNLAGMKDVDMFGWKQAVESGASRLLICEGENDALAWHRIFEIYEKEEYKEYIPAIVSLVNGSSSAKNDIARHLKDINRLFKKGVLLSFDKDKAGEKALEDALKMLPNAKSIVLPLKDANQCLIEGKGKQAYKAAKWDAETPSNSRLVWLDDIWEEAKTPPEFGVSWPWEDVTDRTRGIRKGETIYIGAAQKMGKSELLNQIASHLVEEHGWKVMLAKPEEANVKTVKLLAGKLAHARFHDPKVEFDEEKFNNAIKHLIGRKVCMVNLYQHLGWETLKADIIAAAADGVDAVFIDPITNLTNGINAAEANTKLQEIAQELSAMAKDLNIVIFIFCHLRNPESGLPHDRGGAVLTSQFAGSRAMGRSCNYMFGIEGNKDPDLPKVERNIRTLVLLDDREFGEVGRTRLYWDDNTTLFNEMRD